jgi:tripartite-type tricarboxylate transporter receptor subunit TctC
MQFPRRRFLHLAAGAVAVPALPRIALAQTYPSRPISMIVPYPAGGAQDTIGRIVVERMREPLGQRIIIENIGGADGSIGTGRAARARPDGYTICFGVMDTHVLNGAFYSLSYNVLNDFEPIVPVSRSPDILFARKTMPAKDLNELIAWLKANPNKASAGMSSTNLRLVAMFFQKQTGTQFTIVPYRGASSVIAELRDRGFGGGPDRSCRRHAASITAGARREHQSLRGDNRDAYGGGARHPDL